MRVVQPVPGSKSLTQRALVLAALADGPLALHGALDCDDSRSLTGLLRALGVTVRWPSPGQEAGLPVEVAPARLLAHGERIDCGEAGTALRFGACLALLAEGELLLDGGARLRERPFGPLGEALEALGVAVRYDGRPGYPPVRLARRGEVASPAELTVDAGQSSQFASGLLLVAPRLPGGMVLRLAGAAVSLPYVTMTTRLMERAGAAVRWSGAREVTVAPGGYRAGALPGGLLLEPDWSSAAFLLVAARLLGLELEIPGLSTAERSLQGDAAVVELLAELARPRPHDLDLGPTPDLMAPLAVAALFASHPTRLGGIAHARLKESDRLAVLARGFRQLGARVTEFPGALLLEPLAAPPPAGGSLLLDPAGDHRMAMAFGLAGLRVAGVRVADEGCVSKSFLGFWQALARLRAAANVP